MPGMTAQPTGYAPDSITRPVILEAAICIVSINIPGLLSALEEKLPLYSFLKPPWFPSLGAGHMAKHVSIDDLFDVCAPNAYLLKVNGDRVQGAGI